MKKLVFSGVLAAALICSTSVMAQNTTPKKDAAKPKTEAKAEVKKDEKKSDCCTKKGDKAKADKAKVETSTKTQKTK